MHYFTLMQIFFFIEGGKGLEHANQNNHRARGKSAFAQRLKRRASTTYQRRK